MSKFLEKNKKKSLLGLLFLFVKNRKSTWPLLVMVLVLGFLFVMPSSSNFSMPGFTLLVRRALGKAPAGGPNGTGLEKTSFTGLLAAFRNAKDNKANPWAMLFGRGAQGGAAGSAGSSIDLVKGDASELPGGAEMSKKLGESASVKGVLNREDSKELPEGVAVDQGEMKGEREGWVKSAFAAGPRARVGNAGANGGEGSSSSASADGAGAYAGSDFFSKGRNETSKPGENIRTALTGTQVPSAGATVKVAPSSGKLSRAVVSTMSTRNQAALNRNYIAGGARAFSQLADGRTRAMMARDPICTAAGGCPAEYASTNSGAVYDGNKIGPAAPGVLSTNSNSPAIDGASSPKVPDDSDVQTYQDEADQVTADAEKCKKADQDFKGREDAASAEMKAAGDNLSGACGSCGGACKRAKSRMQRACSNYNSIRCEHTKACPLTASKGCSAANCNQ